MHMACLSQSVQGNRFSAYVMQYGKKVPIQDHALTLARDSFSVVIDMPTKEGVFVHASFNSDTYYMVLDNVPYAQIPNFQPVALFEMWNNPYQELIVTNERPQYWFIESSKKHRFSYYNNINGRYLCVKNVHQLYDPEQQMVVPLNQVKQPLFLSFISFSTAGGNRRVDEIMRHELIIRWK
jgi:hypothetical protein